MLAQVKNLRDRWFPPLLGLAMFALVVFFLSIGVNALLERPKVTMTAGRIDRAAAIENNRDTCLRLRSLNRESARETFHYLKCPDYVK